MPLDSIEDYDRLGEHLTEIDAPLAAFAAKHGYTVYPRLSGGRYPNRRITLEGSIFRTIHVTMDEKPSGERYDRFFAAIPYTLFGGAWISLPSCECPRIQLHRAWRPGKRQTSRVCRSAVSRKSFAKCQTPAPRRCAGSC